MNPLFEKLRQFLYSIPQCLRHPTHRGVAWGVAAIPVAFLLYAMILISFMYSISILGKPNATIHRVFNVADGQLRELL